MHRLIQKAAATLLLPSLVILILALGLAACGSASGATNAVTSANEVDLGSASFARTSAAIGTGESIHFADQQSGTTHILCIGKDGHCDASATGPRDLTGQGFTIQPGQTHDVRFDEAGIYAITCPIHPNMNLLVTVR